MLQSNYVARASALLVWALGCSVAGCVTLLGNDFQTSQRGGDAGDGGNVEGGNVEGGLDASDYLLKCDTLRYPAPQRIGTSDTVVTGGRNFSQDLFLSFSQDRLRVAVGFENNGSPPTDGGPGPQDGFALYSVRVNNPQTPAVQVINGRRLLTTRSGAANFAAMAVDSSASRLTGLVFPNQAGDTDPPQEFAVTSANIVGNQNLRADFVVLDQGDFFWAASYQDGANHFALSVGRASPSLPSIGATLLAQSANEGDVALENGLMRTPGLVHLFGKVNSGGGSGGISNSRMMTVPDSAIVPSPPAWRTLSGPAGGTTVYPLIDSVNGLAPNLVNFAFFQIDPQTPNSPASIRAGTVGFDKLPTFAPPDVPIALTLPSIGDVPSEGHAAWEGDNVLMIGSSPAGGNGLNLLWFDAGSHLRGRRTGANGVLMDRAVRRASATFDSVVGRFARIVIVWQERETRAGGPPLDTIYFNELTCL